VRHAPTAHVESIVATCGKTARRRLGSGEPTPAAGAMTPRFLTGGGAEREPTDAPYHGLGRDTVSKTTCKPWIEASGERAEQLT
jgi:hypothetical protein